MSSQRLVANFSIHAIVFAISGQAILQTPGLAMLLEYTWMAPNLSNAVSCWLAEPFFLTCGSVFPNTFDNFDVTETIGLKRRTSATIKLKIEFYRECRGSLE